MIEIDINKVAKQILTFYDEYNLVVAGKINDSSAFNLIKIIEENYPVDTICFSDGTKIWNLLRVFIYANLQKIFEKDIGEENKRKKINQYNLKSLLLVLRECVTPLNLRQKITICGFSSMESRKFRNGKFYDIYMDPLYDIIEDDFTVFEWPAISGYRRKFYGNVYSKNYVPMHIPFSTEAFWNILFYKIFNRKKISIKSEGKLIEIIDFISKTAHVDKNKLKKSVYDFIVVFYYLKSFFYKILKDTAPKAVLIRCGYGRFPMALSQACRKLNIPSIEFQHGLITRYHPAYIKDVESENRDCVPEYLLTHGDIFAEMVKKSNLFDKKKVVSVGFPYMDVIQKELEKQCKESKIFLSNFKHNILFTSQWILASEIKEFVMSASERLKESPLDVGIILKPHPYDSIDYSCLEKFDNIVLVDKYEDTFKLFSEVDMHSTVYSTSGLEAMAFGKPNIFVDICGITNENDCPFIVSSPDDFFDIVQYILSNHDEISRKATEISKMFFKSSSNENIKEFFSKIGIT